MQVEINGQWYDWDDNFTCLLDWVDAIGLYTDSGCRSGYCHACAAQLIEGQVVYDDPSLDPGDDLVLLCSARPASTLRLTLGRY